MKKSKLFMGLSALVLVVAGMAATKATSKFVTYDYITTTGGHRTCHNGVAACAGGDNKCTAVVISGQNSTVYTTTNTTCTNILNTKS